MVQILAEAEAEIESARKYLSEEAPGAVGRFLEEISDAFDTISARPESFPLMKTLPDNWPYRRPILNKFRYAVIYEIIQDEVIVVAVAHTSRDANYWLVRTR